MERFSRTALLIGNDSLNKLSSAKVLVFGAGGVGGYVLEALARSGIGHIDIVDNDKISISNINRQLFALNSTIGKAKVEVAKKRMLDINPNIKVNAYETFYTKENADEFDFSKYDYIVDAIDTISSKIEIVIRANNAKVPVIASMGAGNKLNATGFMVKDLFKTSYDPLAKVMRRELKKHNIKHLKVVYSEEMPVRNEDMVNSDEIVSGKHSIPGSIAYVPSIVGLIMAGEVIKDLIKE